MKTLSNKIALNLDSDAEVSVKAFIAPIEHTLSNFHVEWEALANLRVAEPEKRHPISIFQSFLPTGSVSVGECWQIEEASVTELLRQLHPNPKLIKIHIDTDDPRGLWGCLRAYNDKLADITFRIHAAFDFEDGTLTPSQFKGNLIIDRSENKVTFFKMYVPEGTVNLDITWKKYKDHPYRSTDSGLCYQMELRSGIEDEMQNADFTEAITQKEAEQALILRFYEIAQINWVPPEKAVELAEEQMKLIHVISIDGPLHDESC
ncbi:MAG: hypothetical protein OXL96_14485 [Candidatus Poribacteria bacterium]|nr:hypothetical protein [Candidatus Poribacteria bacterium]